jgi:hypothetical protein
MLHLFYNFKNTQEAQNIWENELPSNSIGKTQNFQEDVYFDSYEEFHSCHDTPLYSSSSPSMVSRLSKRNNLPKNK